MTAVAEAPRTPRGIAAAKLIAILGFLALLWTSFHLRSEALELNRIRFSPDEARAAHELERLKRSQPGGDYEAGEP